MIKPKRKVSIFAIYKVQFLVLIFLLLSVVTSFLTLYYTNSKLTISNLVCGTIVPGVPVTSILFSIYWFAYPLYTYLKELPSIIVAKDKISRLPLTREELTYLNINSLEEYFEYIQENIRSTYKLLDEDSTLALNDFIFLTKEQEYCFQLFTKNLMMDAREGKFNFYKENSKFANVDKHKPDIETVKFNLVTNSMYDYDEYYEIFKNVFTSYNRRTVEIVIKKYNSK